MRSRRVAGSALLYLSYGTGVRACVRSLHAHGERYPRRCTPDYSLRLLDIPALAATAFSVNIQDYRVSRINIIATCPTWFNLVLHVARANIIKLFRERISLHSHQNCSSIPSVSVAYFFSLRSISLLSISFSLPLLPAIQRAVRLHGVRLQY